MNDAPSNCLRVVGDKSLHPVRMLWVIAGGVAVAEVFFELLVYWRPAMPPHVEAVMDGGFILVITLLLGYGIMYRPMRSLIDEYRLAINEVRTLRGIITICSACKNIRTGDESWAKIEEYVHAHTEAEFSHGLCPDCIQRLYPEDADWVSEQMKLHRPHSQDAGGTGSSAAPTSSCRNPARTLSIRLGLRWEPTPLRAAHRISAITNGRTIPSVSTISAPRKLAVFLPDRGEVSRGWVSTGFNPLPTRWSKGRWGPQAPLADGSLTHNGYQFGNGSSLSPGRQPRSQFSDASDAFLSSLTYEREVTIRG